MEIKKSIFETSATKPEQYPSPKYEEVILLGRSNVGKSTFINSLTNNKKLAYISSKPGKTQIINFFLINDLFYLVDVPGYGYAKVSKTKREQFGQMIEKYLTSRPTLKLAVLLVDFKVGPTKDDILMQKFLNYYNIKTLVVATKKDKVNKTLQPKQMNKIVNNFEGILHSDILAYSKNDKDTIQIVTNRIFDIIEG